MSRKSTNQQYSGHITVSQQPAVPQTNPLKKNGPAAASGASPSPVAGNNNNNNNSSVSSGPRPNSGSNKKAPPLSFASAVAATVSKPNSFIANSSLPSAATPNRPVNSLPAAQPSAPNTTGKRNDSFKPSGSASAAPPSNSAVNKGVKPASSPVAVRIPQRESIAGHIGIYLHDN
ncbi:hypothetical protein EV182_001576 [Spiromyces aspiralis]|uniref:Uncharacterized protein n=1 Tax=Spiromyces aspiralis TaxID=68401 RepID=A0ACC1HMY9_9FUNG|nr:hypothetical protein EV182_001576 [Spiromyces aspiralis]